MNNFELYLMTTIIVPVIVYFVNKGMKDALKGANRKSRFNIFSTSLLESILIIGVIFSIINMEYLSSLFTVDVKIGLVGIGGSFLFLHTLLSKFIYRPMSKKQDESDREYRKKNRKPWICNKKREYET